MFLYKKILHNIFSKDFFFFKLSYLRCTFATAFGFMFTLHPRLMSPPYVNPFESCHMEYGYLIGKKIVKIK